MPIHILDKAVQKFYEWQIYNENLESYKLHEIFFKIVFWNGKAHKFFKRTIIYLQGIWIYKKLKINSELTNSRNIGVILLNLVRSL